MALEEPNTAKVDYRRITEEHGLELLLELNGMRREDVRIVDCPFADGWYEGPGMKTVAGPPDFWHTCSVGTDLLQCPLRPEVEAGAIDACFATDPFGLAGRVRSG